MTVDFRHRSSNFRHKTASITKFHFVMDCVDAKCALNANHTASRKASFARAESK
jgi:hypothetical protein